MVPVTVKFRGVNKCTDFISLHETGQRVAKLTTKLGRCITLVGSFIIYLAIESETFRVVETI